jgi:hypothetical protein
MAKALPNKRWDVYSYRELSRATDHFSDDNILGEGRNHAPHPSTSLATMSKLSRTHWKDEVRKRKDSKKVSCAIAASQREWGLLVSMLTELPGANLRGCCRSLEFDWAGVVLEFWGFRAAKTLKS